MAVILGIDAAWTQNGSTGVAVVASEHGHFHLVAVESSYDAFVEKSGLRSAMGGLPAASALLEAAKVLAGAEVDIVAIDMPMSKLKFDTRREADQQISKIFGRHKAGTHSPSVARPGALGRHISRSFQDLNFSLATQLRDRPPALIEVYPHTALIRLMGCEERRKYKVEKSKAYWKNETIAQRIDLLLAEWHDIIAALSDEIGGISLNSPPEFQTLSAMKPYEDKLDAIVSAWVGAKFWLGKAQAYGDEYAAIWVPV